MHYISLNTVFIAVILLMVAGIGVKLYFNQQDIDRMRRDGTLATADLRGSIFTARNQLGEKIDTQTAATGAALQTIAKNIETADRNTREAFAKTAENVERKFDAVDKRFGSMEGRLGEADRRLDGVTDMLEPVFRQKQLDYYKYLMADLPAVAAPTMRILNDLMQRDKLPVFVLLDDHASKLKNAAAPYINRQYFDVVPAVLPNVDMQKTCLIGYKPVARFMQGSPANDSLECPYGNHFWVMQGGNDFVKHSQGLTLIAPGAGDDTLELGHGTKILVMERGWGHDFLNAECSRGEVRGKKFPFDSYSVAWPLQYKSSIVFGPGVSPADLRWEGHKLLHKNGRDSITFKDLPCYNFIFSEAGALGEKPQMPRPIGDCQMMAAGVPDLGTMGLEGENIRGSVILSKLSNGKGPARADLKRKTACGDAGMARLVNMLEVIGSPGPDTMIASEKNNRFDGKEGADVYELEFDGSADVISDAGYDSAVDQVWLRERNNEVVFSRNGNDLMIYHRKKTGSAKILNWFNGETNPIEEIRILEGYGITLSPQQVNARLENPPATAPVQKKPRANADSRNPSAPAGMMVIDGGSGDDTLVIKAGPGTTYDAKTRILCQHGKCMQLKNVENVRIE